VPALRLRSLLKLNKDASGTNHFPPRALNNRFVYLEHFNKEREDFVSELSGEPRPPKAWMKGNGIPRSANETKLARLDCASSFAYFCCQKYEKKRIWLQKDRKKEELL
jgi:hypothetical protein